MKQPAAVILFNCISALDEQDLFLVLSIYLYERQAAVPADEYKIPRCRQCWTVVHRATLVSKLFYHL
jgi:hypothetical protein